jgi:hypothetical protein
MKRDGIVFMAYCVCDGVERLGLVYEKLWIIDNTNHK